MTRLLYFVGLVAILVGTTSGRSITFAVEEDGIDWNIADDIIEDTTIRPRWYNKVLNLLDNFRGGSIIFVYFPSQIC